MVKMLAKRRIKSGIDKNQTACYNKGSFGVVLIAAAPPWAIRALWTESPPRLLYFQGSQKIWHKWHTPAHFLV